MGILDDAIREHLELKRRRGADPNELEREEQEALGPVRRTRGEAFEASLTDEPGPDMPYGQEEFAEGRRAESAEPAWTKDDAELLEVDEIEEWEPPGPGPVRGGIPVEPDSPAPAMPAPPDPDEGGLLEQETVEHDIEAEHARDAEQAPESEPGDDMLEETPEFLQDTPDHDRLWFEQRPPRDFDLGG